MLGSRGHCYIIKIKDILNITKSNSLIFDQLFYKRN